jgi:uncharacterized protein (TIGR02646 family)
MSDYTLKNLIPELNAVEDAIIAANPLTDKKQWTNGTYNSIKLRIKEELYFNQYDRCAYCRRVIEADAKYEPMDHIVAKSIKPEWMFEPHNLVVTCDSCNNLKNDDPTLTTAHINDNNFPQTSDSFLVFNPHFDTWSEHLRYEDDIFLVGVPNSKGADTIRICKLYRYNIIINRAKELKLEQKTPTERAIQRFGNMQPSNPDYQLMRDQLLLAMSHFLQRMQNDPNFQ